MIKTFKHKGIEAFFNSGTKKGIQPEHSDRISDMLDIVDAAAKAEDIYSPGLRLYPLYPKGSNTWAVDVSGNWRIIFRFENSDAYDLDYHGKRYKNPDAH